MAEKIVVKNLSKIFGDSPDKARQLLEKGRSKAEIFEETGSTVGVDNASFEVRSGETFVVMGLSGSGKSTLVRLLNRLIEPTAGTVEIDGRDVTNMPERDLIELRRRDMAMVFQSFALMPHQTALQNAAFGLEVAGVPREQREQRAMDALESVGLAANAGSFPRELSGGMQQRVGLARALANDPSIMLMDEAFSALDPLIRTEMQDELLRLQEEHQRTVVFISHDLDEAMRIGDRIAIMQEGAVVQVGTPDEIVSSPANDYVRAFFKGVDVNQVFSAGDIARRRGVEVLERPGMNLSSALERMRQNDSEWAVVIEKGNRYRGLVTFDAMLRESRKDSANHAWPFDDDVAAVDADQPLSEVLGTVASSRWPVPVVDSDGRFRGTISKTVLLETLDRSTDED